MLIFTNLSSDTEEFTQDIQTCSTTQVDVLVTYRVGVQLLWVCCLECLYNHRCTDWLYSCNIDNVECDGALATVEWTYICNLWVCTCGCVHVGVYMWVCTCGCVCIQCSHLSSIICTLCHLPPPPPLLCSTSSSKQLQPLLKQHCHGCLQ